MSITPPPAPGVDQKTKTCSSPGCKKFGSHGAHTGVGDRLVEVWWCVEHKPTDWPKAR